MKVLKLVLKNMLRHKLRTFLTVLGISIAVMAFGFMRTIVTAWNYGVEASAENRMITRNSVSFIFPLPISYREKILNVPGVQQVTYANWFSGIYKDPADFKNFFPRIAVDPETWFEVYPEFIMTPEELATFKKERNSCIVGRKLAAQHGFKLGDDIQIEGDIYPGTWHFTVRGIYRGKDATTDETQMFFPWKYVEEQTAQLQPGREVGAGWYIFKVKHSSDIPIVSKTIDDMFMNSRAATKTETEKAFAQSFVSMSSAILTSLEVVSYVIIGIILLVLANTVVMSVRERMREYAVLKTLGFSAVHIIGLIGGESMFLALIGGIIGLLLTFPIAYGFATMFPTMFPVFTVEPVTIAMAIGSAILAGIVAALFPTARVLRQKIVDGLRMLA